mmetsp:Transcript_42271/g.116922  ORF Transcript_42271/g.116922 Transcript_42271/m.116922 type:complete len:993 (-) Transcript_42271:2191-5169(-)
MPTTACASRMATTASTKTMKYTIIMSETCRCSSRTALTGSRWMRVARDMALFARLLNESGRQVMLENCHWGMCWDTEDGRGISGWGWGVAGEHDWREGNSGCPERLPDGNVTCPFHVFRTSGDIDSSEFNWLRNLESTVRFLDRDAPLAGRGCWAYPDMVRMGMGCEHTRVLARSRSHRVRAALARQLEVGNLPDWMGLGWQQAHFGAWCIMSSPLILGFDLRDDELVAKLWPFLANKEAIAVSQTWGGHPGWRLKGWTPDGSSQIGYRWRNLDSEHVFTANWPLHVMQVWVKPLPQGRVAVLIINADQDSEHTYSFKLTEINFRGPVSVRDIWGRKDRGFATVNVEGVVPALSSDFIVLAPANISGLHLPPPVPPQPPAPPPLPASPPCHSWCSTNLNTWFFKCTEFSACAGCDDCYATWPPFPPASPPPSLPPVPLEPPPAQPLAPWLPPLAQLSALPVSSPSSSPPVSSPSSSLPKETRTDPFLVVSPTVTIMRQSPPPPLPPATPQLATSWTWWSFGHQVAAGLIAIAVLTYAAGYAQGWFTDRLRARGRGTRVALNENVAKEEETGVALDAGQGEAHPGGDAHSVCIVGGSAATAIELMPKKRKSKHYNTLADEAALPSHERSTESAMPHTTEMTDAPAPTVNEMARAGSEVEARQTITSVTTSRQAAYRPDVDGLRAVAVVAVIIFHFDSNRLPGGFVGVDVFFVISGYVVCGSLLRERTAPFGAFVAAFYTRRLKRLAPALLAVVLVTLVWISQLIPPYTPQLHGYYRTASLALIGWSNQYFATLPTGYFDEGDAGLQFNPFTHTWSLGVEEQFYFCFPLLIYLLFGQGCGACCPGTALAYCRARPRAVLTATLLMSMVVCALLTQREPRYAFYTLPSRFWQLMSGALLFTLQDADHGRFELGRIGCLLTEAAAVLLLSFAFAFTPSKTGFPLPWSIPAIAGALCAIASGSMPRHHLAFGLHTPLLGSLLGKGAVVYVGKLSYPL